MQEASRPSDVIVPAEAQAQGSLDAANAAQFVSHLEDDPLVQDMEAAGGLSMRDQGPGRPHGWPEGLRGISQISSLIPAASHDEGDALQDHEHIVGQPGGETGSLCMCMHVRACAPKRMLASERQHIHNAMGEDACNSQAGRSKDASAHGSG